MPVQLGNAFGSISLDIGPLRTAAQGVQGAMRQIGDALKGVGQSDVSTKLTGQMDKLRNTINLQVRQYQILEAELDKVAQKEGLGSTAAQKKLLALDKLNVGIDNNRQKLAGLSQQLDQSNNGFNRLREGLQAAGASLTQTGAIMTAGITAPLALLGKQAVDIGGDYEQAMSVLQATTQASASQMAQAGDMAKALGADLQLPGASAADAGETMLKLAQAGLSVNEAISESRGTMQLAAADNLSNAQAAEIAASAYNNFRAQGVSVAQVADLLAASISSAGSGVMQSGQAIQQYGAAAAAAHIPIRDVVTQIDLMARAGIKGSDAGTSLKTMLQRLQAPTKDAAAEMERLNISVYDSAGNMRPMREIVGQFSQSLGGLTQQERDRAVVTIFGSDAQRAANLVLAQGVEAYDKMYTAVGRQGAAADMAGARMHGLKGALEGFRSTAETAQLDAVEPFLSSLAAIVNGASAVISAFMSVDPTIRNTVVIFGAALAASGPLILAFGALATAAATVELPMLATAAAVSAVIAGLLSGNPIIIGAAGAVTVWAAAQQLKALPALLASIPAIIAQTAALVANAAVTAAAAAPVIALGVAIAGLVYVWEKYNNIANDAAQKLIEVNAAYTGSTATMKRYNEASSETRMRLAEQYDQLQRLQSAQEDDAKQRAQMAEAGQMESQAYAENTARMNERTDTIKTLAAQMNQEIDAENNQAAAAQNNTQAHQESARAVAEAAAKQLAASGDIEGALQKLRDATNLADEDIKQYAKDLEKAAEEGAKAFGQAVTGEVGFLKDREDAEASHGDKLEGIKQDTAEKIAKLTKEHNRRMAELGASAQTAESGAATTHGTRITNIHAATQTKIANLTATHERRLESLQAQLSGATTDKARASLQRRIANEQASYNQSIALAQGAAQRKVDAETSAQTAATTKARAGADKRIADEQASYNEQLAALQGANKDKLAEEEKAYKAAELKAAEAYAREQAAQLAHLGQMLINYTTAQAKMAGISDQKVAEMTAKIAAQYGVQASVIDRSYAQMTGSIDAWVANGGQNTDTYIANMGRVQAGAVAMQQQVDAKIAEMTAQARADFETGKISADEYAAKLSTIPAAAERAVQALSRIPTQITVDVKATATRTENVGGKTVKTDATSGRTATGGTYSGTRAGGGPVPAGTFAKVVEDGPELLQIGGDTFLMMGQQSGTVTPARGMAGAMAGAFGRAGAAVQTGLAGAGAALRDALAPRTASALRASFAAQASLAQSAAAAGGSASMAGATFGVSGGHTFNSPVTINNPVVDSSARVKELAAAIATHATQAARRAVSGDLSKAVDRLITAGGTKR